MKIKVTDNVNKDHVYECEGGYFRMERNGTLWIWSARGIGMGSFIAGQWKSIEVLD